MKNKILDFIDFEKVDTLLEGFNKSTGFVTAILDLDGNVLSKSGWRQICTEFHRINPETSKKCTISDTLLAGKMAEGEKYHFYKCLNGLIDVAVPIVINGEHIANLFSGQFFFEEPDRNYFIKQAQEFGFNEEQYLEALEKVPVVSKEKVLDAMDFLLSMTQLISESTFQKLEQIELNNTIIKSEEKFKAVFESANVGKSITLLTGEIDVNQSFCDMLGYPQEELKNKKWQDITPEDEIPAVQNKLEPLLKGEKDSARFEKRYICKNGTHIWADLSVTILRDNRGEPLYFITTVIDITERKQVEEKQAQTYELLTNLARLVPGVIYQYRLYPDGSSAFPYSSPGMYSIYEVTPEQVREDATPIFGRLHPEDADRVSNLIFESARTLEEFYCEFRVILPEQGLRWRWSQAHPERTEDGGTIWHGIISDITERKQAENALRESERHLRNSQQIAHIGSWRLDVATNQVVWTEELYHMYGFDPALPPPPYTEHMKLFTPASWEKLSTSLAKTRETGIPYVLELETVKEDGSNGWMWVRGEVTKDSDGNTIGLWGAAQDITERKRNENTLRESEERFATLFERSAFVAVLSKLPNGVILNVNGAFEETFGFTKKEAFGKTTFELGINPDAAGRERVLAQLQKYGSVRNLDLELHIKSGEIHMFSVSVDLIDIGDEKYILNTMQDITERKQKEKDLQASEDRFRRAVISAPIPIMIHAEDGQVITINTPWTQLTGYEHSDIPTIADWTRKAYGNGTQMDLIREDIDHLYTLDGPKEEGEYTITTSSGEQRIWDFSSAPIGQLSDGRRIVISMAMDVTERKRVETERKKFFLLAESSSEFIGMCDLELNPIYVNPAGQHLVGLPDLAAACRVKVPDYFFPEDQRFIAEEFFPRVLREGHGDVEIRLRHFLSGESIWMYYYLFSVRDANGTLIGWATVSHDITERKQAEDALRESENRFSTVFFTNPTAQSVLSQITGKVIEVNDACCSLYGYSRAELLGAEPGQLELWANPADQLPILDELQRTSHLLPTEVRIRNKSGKTHTVLFAVEPLTWKDIPCLLTSSIDITERKRAEEEVHRLNAELEKRVAERTAELRGLVSAMAGREVRMAELKDVIRQLRGQLEQSGLTPVADDPLAGL